MPAPRILNGHVVTGTMLLAVGGVGLTRFWDSLGLVSRGLVPFGLLGGGFVMVGAGVQTMRRRATNPARRTSLAPLFTALIGIALALANPLEHADFFQRRNRPRQSQRKTPQNRQLVRLRRRLDRPPEDSDWLRQMLF